MSRKERRAARKQAASLAGGTGARAEAFAAAVRSHQAGQFTEAERLYREVLSRDGGHVNSLRNLGILALQTTRPALAVEMFGRLLAIEDRTPDCHYNLALAFAALARPDDAARHYVRAVDLKPDYTEAHMNLGNLHKEAGRLEEAVQCYRQVLRHAGESGPILYNLANVLAEQGQFEEAEQRLRRAIALAPGLAQASNSLGNVLLEQGRVDEALESYRRALVLDARLVPACANIGHAMLLRGDAEAAAAQFQHALELDPDYPEAHHGLGTVRLSQGRADEAMPHFERAIALRPNLFDAYVNAAVAALALGDIGAALAALRLPLQRRPTPRAKALFVDCARWVQNPPGDAEFEATLRTALVESWGPAGDLGRLAAKLLRNDAKVGAMIGLAEQHWPGRVSGQQLWGAEGPRVIAENCLLAAMLSADRICDPAVEKFLTLLRSAFLEAAWNARSTTVDDADLTLLCAIAEHCFRNEYVYGVTDEEQRQVDALRRGLAEQFAGGQAFPMTWFCVAAYGPLGTLEGAERLCERAWPAPVEALVTQQVREPQEERRLRAGLNVMTPVVSTVSRRVMEQYEENPYPRWRDAPAVDRSRSIEHYLRTLFPTADIAGEGQSRPDILIAGCGTGLQVIGTARRFPQARILAIDLSKSSLAYAMRQAARHGISNVEYAQADLLDLATTGRRFDVIETAGALHHLADPFAGWRALLELLRPGGYMFVSLDSAMARSALAPARQLVAQHGFGGDIESVRRLRQEVLASAAPEGLSAVVQSDDFYTTSGCRDLLLRMQGVEMRLPEIKAFIQENRLALLGILVDESVRRQFRKRHPEDGALTDLDLWQAFEADHPWAFAQMYSFWIRKDAAGPASMPN